MYISNLENSCLLNDVPQDINVNNIIHNLLFNFGGYIAGGFALKLARLHFGFEKNDSVNDYIKNADFDFYFQNDQDYAASCSFFKKLSLSDKDVIFSNGSIVLDNKSSINVHYHGQKIQLLGTFNDTIENQLMGFDISNCCVAYTGRQLKILNIEKWYDNEISDTLHVKQWNSATPWRVAKYINHRGYKHLDEENKEKFINMLIQLGVRERIDVFRYSKKIISDLELLKLSALTPKNYDAFYKELLVRRGIKR